jgi:hypothetical protein
MGLQSFERHLERMVDGVFARAFRSSLRPVELGRRLVREMDDHRSVDVRGRTIVPNDFTFTVSTHDLEAFADINEALIRELCDAAREHARDEQYSFMGPVRVALTEDSHFKAGRFSLTSHMQEPAPGSTEPVAALVLSDGTRIGLGEESVTIGRLPECGIVVADPNVSRRHAVVRPAGNGWAVADLKSTNGTRVNGIPITERSLSPGDQITLGATVIRFETV